MGIKGKRGKKKCLSVIESYASNDQKPLSVGNTHKGTISFSCILFRGY